MKLKMILATAAIATVTVFSGTAQASTSSTVNIKGTHGDYYGKVKSYDSDCLVDRTVVVYEQYGYTPDPHTDGKIGYDTTDYNGKWSIGNSGQYGGTYYAKVKKSTYCGGAISQSIHG